MREFPHLVSEEHKKAFEATLPGTLCTEPTYCPCGQLAVRVTLVSADLGSSRRKYRWVHQAWHQSGYPYCRPCSYNGKERLDNFRI